MISSGMGSAVAAKRVATMYPNRTVLLFSDVNGEDPDNYRFLLEAWQWIGAPLVILDNGGKTIWDVFRTGRFLGNSRADLCSRVLKREVMRAWLEENHEPDNTVVHIGYDLDEGHRVKKARPHWEPWRAEAPLCWEPGIWKDDAVRILRDAGIAPPILTRLGYPHANCGGMCVKMGHKQARKTLRTLPERYAEWEKREEEFRVFIGKPVAIMRDRTGGESTPLSLREFRSRMSTDPNDLDDDWGSCNCMGDFSAEGEAHEIPPIPVDARAITDPDEVAAYLRSKIRPVPPHLFDAAESESVPLFGTPELVPLMASAALRTS